MKPDTVALAAKAAEALSPLLPRFGGQTALVFAPGPSLKELWEGRKSDLPKIVVNDAHRLVPDADLLWAADQNWWVYHKCVPSFRGIKAGYHTTCYPEEVIAVQGSGCEGYDDRLGYVRHGANGGHTAVHLAAQLGAKRIVLIGFDMRTVGGKHHFFGDHPPEFRRTNHYGAFVRWFKPLADELKARGVEVVNATPDSALEWFPFVDLDSELWTEAA